MRSKYDELEADHDALIDELEKLEAENEALKKLMPASSSISGTNEQPAGDVAQENERLIKKNLHLGKDSPNFSWLNIFLASEVQKVTAENDELLSENQLLKKYLDDINLLSSQMSLYTSLK